MIIISRLLEKCHSPSGIFAAVHTPVLNVHYYTAASIVGLHDISLEQVLLIFLLTEAALGGFLRFPETGQVYIQDFKLIFKGKKCSD